MSSILASEGGWQSFTLSNSDWTMLIFSAVVAVLALAVGALLMKDVLAADQGSASMREIAAAIQEGAAAYLRRQFKTIAIIVVPLAVIVFVTSSAALSPDGSQGLSWTASGLFRTLAFVAGCLLSGLIGFIGMGVAVRGNVRTAAAAQSESMADALKVAFRTGSVAGMFTVGFGLLGATLIIMIFQNTASAILVGFGFGGSLLALFLRVGGGIFTKAADVGADLVGKVEAGIPEDDARNPATIADNVGDNVGDCAGMASDLFESYVVMLVASIILGVGAFVSVGFEFDSAKGLIFPLMIHAIGVLASILGIFIVRWREGDRNAMQSIRRGFVTSSVVALIGTFALAYFYVGFDSSRKISNIGLMMFLAVLAGVVLAQLASWITEVFTSTEHEPVRDIARSSRTGPATVVLSGLSSGMESAVYAILAIAGAIGVAAVLGQGNILFSLYLVSLAGMGMLSTTGIIVSEDTFGPVADNAAGIAEMAGEFEGEPERIMVSLDAVGNTTKAVTKGFAIGSAVIAAVALFASFIEVVGSENGVIGERAFTKFQINVADPKIFIGLLIGGSVAFLFSSFAIRAVSRTAGVVVEEVRRQFRENPGIMDRSVKPEYGKVIDICTTASLRELSTPALLAVLTPIAVGFGLGPLPLGAFLAGAILTGQLMANFQSNAGGAWDNAKKYIEDGHEGGKGSEAHKAAVIGDTVGDPFKDTSGPALNPLIKVINLISLLVLPAIIALEGTAAAAIIAIVAVVILVGAVVVTKKRGASGLDEDTEAVEEPANA